MKTPLHQALLNANIKSAEKHLTNADAKEWCKTQYRGYTPLAIACKKDLEELLILKLLTLFPDAASIPTKPDRGDYPVHLCAKYGSMSSTVIEALLMQYPQVLELKSRSNVGILMKPEQLARGNSALPELAKNALLQPIAHWILLKDYIKNVYDFDEDEIVLNGGKYNLIGRKLTSLQNELVTSKNTEYVAIQTRCATIKT